MQGLGRTERRLAGRPLVTRADIAAAAADLLKDKEQKKQLQPHEPKILRQARRSDASSVTLQRARQILAGRTPQMRIETGFADLPDGSPTRLTVRPEQGGYGGSEGGQSTDATSGVVSRQEGGPVTAGRAYSVGDAPGASADTPKPETFVPDALKGPHGGEMVGAGKLWNMLLEGGKDLNARLREAGRAAFFEPEAYDPSAPLELAGRIPGRAMLPIKTALGARKLKKETAAQ